MPLKGWLLPQTCLHRNSCFSIFRSTSSIETSSIMRIFRSLIFLVISTCENRRSNLDGWYGNHDGMHMVPLWLSNSPPSTYSLRTHVHVNQVGLPVSAYVYNNTKQALLSSTNTAFPPYLDRHIITNVILPRNIFLLPDWLPRLWPDWLPRLWPDWLPCLWPDWLQRLWLGVFTWKKN